MTHEYLIKKQSIINMHMALKLNSPWLAYLAVHQLEKQGAAGSEKNIKENEFTIPHFL